MKQELKDKIRQKAEEYYPETTHNNKHRKVAFIAGMEKVINNPSQYFEQDMSDEDIPDWIKKYDSLNYQSSAGKAIRFLMEAVNKKEWKISKLELEIRHLEGYKAAQQPIPQGWIDVKDRLPENGQRVIVVQNPKTTATRESLYAEFNGEKFVSVGFSHDGIHLGFATWTDIVLWQPLPTPPNEKP